MTFSAKFRYYIGVGTLAPRPTALGGLLPPRAMALRPDATAHGVRGLLPPRAMALRPDAAARGARPLMPRPTVLCP
jgi:hypothetical protein